MSYLDDLDEDELDAVREIGTSYLDELCGYEEPRRNDDWQPGYEEVGVIIPSQDEKGAVLSTLWDLGVLPAGHPFAEAA